MNDPDNGERPALITGKTQLARMYALLAIPAFLWLAPMFFYFAADEFRKEKLKNALSSVFLSWPYIIISIGVAVWALSVCIFVLLRDQRELTGYVFIDVPVPELFYEQAVRPLILIIFKGLLAVAIIAIAGFLVLLFFVY